MSDDDFEDNIDGIKSGENTQPRAFDGGHDNGDDARTDDQQRLERIFRVLTNAHRRYILYELQDQEAVTLDELARAVIAMQQEIPPEKADSEAVDRTKTRLIHADIPKLEEVGFVEYDHRSRTIRYSYSKGVLDKFLRLCASVDAPSKPKK